METNKSEGISRIISEQIPQFDHIEMSGKYISAVIRYEVEANKFFWINRELVWPMLSTILNNTNAIINRSFNLDPIKLSSINKIDTTGNR